MRFGFMLFTRDLHAVGDAARLAEERGFDLIGVADSPALTFDPYTALTQAALATRRAHRDGGHRPTGAASPDHRQPGRVARCAGVGPVLPRPWHRVVRRATCRDARGPAGRPRGSAVRQNAKYRLAERLGLAEYLFERFSIAGTLEDCCREIEHLRAAGIANICFNLGTVNNLEATLDLFGREVLPAFAGSP
jgi:alkanesulfonate monooxygenase SsuD/methylene tetrahydromethanopterin reductase-like flavin-dependent oxidoreductase (luciferase family)